MARPGQDSEARGGSWRHAGGLLELDRCHVMAIVNVTPDSFFDGGRWSGGPGEEPSGCGAIVEQCRRWIACGASILDVGGESTRPGAEPVGRDEERGRVVPVIAALAADEVLRGTPISVDTRHAVVARAALEAGATIVNDISTLADEAMAGIVAEAGAGLVISHLRGDPRTMQRDLHFEDLVAEVGDELALAVEVAVGAGVERERILVDPGLGFGKSAEQSAALACASAELRRRCGCPVLIGASRKSFLGHLLGRGGQPLPAAERMVPSVLAAVFAARHGAAVVRVHDVVETARALELGAALEAARQRHGLSKAPLARGEGR